MMRMFTQNLSCNRFNMKSFICRERVQKYYSGTVHFEHPLMNQNVQIDQNGCILPIKNNKQTQEMLQIKDKLDQNAKKVEGSDLQSHLSTNQKKTLESQNFNQKPSFVKQNMKKNDLKQQQVQQEQVNQHKLKKTKIICKKSAKTKKYNLSSKELAKLKNYTLKPDKKLLRQRRKRN